MEKHTVVAVDIAKVVFDLAASHEPGRVGERRRLPRKAFLTHLAQMPAASSSTGMSSGGFGSSSQKEAGRFHMSW